MIAFRNLGSLGRLGNQLFQIAVAVGYARKYGQEYAFTDWRYSQHFNVPINPEEFVINHSINEHDSLSYEELPEYNHSMGHVNFYGYFQSEKYFINAKQEILRLFKSSNEKIDYGFIHIRRGDYLNLSEYHTNLPISYYIEGMNELDFDKYVCVSDDIQWCKENIKDIRVSFSENTSEIEDLRLIEKCKGGVIANSSFSWWGAYLSESKNIIIPKNWYGPAFGSYNIEDKLCEGWKIL